jgi:hypothetical protein
LGAAWLSASGKYCAAGNQKRPRPGAALERTGQGDSGRMVNRCDCCRSLSLREGQACPERRNGEGMRPPARSRRSSTLERDRSLRVVASRFIIAVKADGFPKLLDRPVDVPLSGEGAPEVVASIMSDVIIDTNVAVCGGARGWYRSTDSRHGAAAPNGRLYAAETLCVGRPAAAHVCHRRPRVPGVRRQVTVAGED